MKKPAANVPASILAKLKNISEKENCDFNFLLLRYFQERFLARLAASKYVNKFVLKGGFLLLAYHVARARSTKDIDVPGVDITSDRKGLEQIIKSIISIKMDDGVVFIADSLKSEEVTEEAEYPGIRIRVAAKIGTAKNTIQLDFGFGNVVIPEPLPMDYPTLLNDKSATILAYSKETIIAEKFEAIVKFSSFNSRMKDFFDIVFLANEFDYNGATLQEAIGKTFTQRNTDLNAALEVFESDFGDQPEFKTAWEAFKKRTKLSTGILFKTVFTEIQDFLKPLIVSEIFKKPIERSWDKNLKNWKE
jgi:hypothetical protein